MEIVNPAFEDRINKIIIAFKEPTHINGGPRNPVHNAYHVTKGKSSGTVSASWHQYGCAIDFQTFPQITEHSSKADSNKARAYFDRLSKTARLIDPAIRIEPMEKNAQDPKRPFSGIGHVHVEERCYEMAR